MGTLKSGYYHSGYCVRCDRWLATTARELKHSEETGHRTFRILRRVSARRPGIPGERNPQAKLNEIKAAKIKSLKGKVSTYKLAKEHGVSQAAIWSCQADRTWKKK